MESTHTEEDKVEEDDAEERRRRSFIDALGGTHMRERTVESETTQCDESSFLGWRSEGESNSSSPSSAGLANSLSQKVAE